MCKKLCKIDIVIVAGKKIVLRNPRMSDAGSILRLINALVEEDAPILANRKFTLREEIQWIKHIGEMIRKNKVHAICAFHDKEYIGNVTLEKDSLRKSHVGTIGIALKKEYRGIGLGTLLLKKIIGIAKQDKEIKVLELGVLPENTGAKSLYEKLGFKVVAKLPRRIFYKGKYTDEYIMDYPLSLKG